MLLPQIARFEPGSPIVVTTPNYHPDFVAAAKRLNGRFVDGKWRFDARDEERVRFACTQVWGACEGDALAERLGYEPTREQLRDLETQIRAKLDEAVKTIGAQNIDTVIADIGETGSAKIARNGDLLTRREENSDWLFCGTVEPEDRNDVLQALYDAGKLFGDWRPAE